MVIIITTRTTRDMNGTSVTSDVRFIVMQSRLLMYACMCLERSSMYGRIRYMECCQTMRILCLAGSAATIWINWASGILSSLSSLPSFISSNHGIKSYRYTSP